jgi:hypothetical protein
MGVLDDYDCKDHPLLDVFPNARRFRSSGHNDRPIYDCVDAETLERAMELVTAAIAWCEAEADESNSLAAQLRIDDANCSLIDAIDAFAAIVAPKPY